MIIRSAILCSFAFLSTSIQAGIVSSFTETFGGGAYDHAAWEPMNAGSSITLLGSSTDRDHWDGPNDGGLLIERGVEAPGTYGARLSLGMVAEEDVGSCLSVDFAYEKPADGYWNLKPLFELDGKVIAEGVPVSVFSTGNDPGAAMGQYSSVLVRLACLITRLDVGKELFLIIRYSDGNIAENRDLLLDAVNFINTGDEVELPGVSVSLSGVGTNAAMEVNYHRRISKGLPALQYIWHASEDLSPWSWMGAVAAETDTLPMNADYEEVTHRFEVGAASSQFLRLTVRNKRLGDPNVTFDEDKMDPDYPQMLEWQKAGVEGGIPYRFERPVVAVLEPTDSAGINAALNEVWRDALAMGGGTVLLKNGTYIIDQTVNMPPAIQLVGESREGVELLVTMTTGTDPQEVGNAIYFFRVFNSGVVNLTMRGAYGTPNPSTMQNVKPEFMVNFVSLFTSDNCWVDDVTFLDSGTHPLTGWRSSHVTVRGCYVDGAWNKGAGGRGYFSVMSNHWLIVENHVRRLRHFGLQKEHCEYNVVFRNFIEQDVNFHDDDNGNNLIEGNRIALPNTLQSNWHAVMGPWSKVQHTISRNDNFVFNNKCIEYNNGGIEVFSDTGLVYLGARRYEQDGNPFDSTGNIPGGGTFFPVILAPSSND